MKRVFADTSYWIALLNPRDELHATALSMTAEIGEARIVTTEMVLVELLNSFSEGGPAVRKVAANAVEALRRNIGVTVEPQTPEQFAAGLRVYARSLDKDWSMTDCVSFQVMDRLGISSALTYDRHFVQAGYSALLR